MKFSVFVRVKILVDSL